jgi:hypothetical protein
LFVKSKAGFITWIFLFLSSQTSLPARCSIFNFLVYFKDSILRAERSIKISNQKIFKKKMIIKYSFYRVSIKESCKIELSMNIIDECCYRYKQQDIFRY